MASIDTTNPNVRAVVFVKIELDGLTLRFATENTYATDTDGQEYFWEGRVVSVSDVSAGFNDFRDAQAIVSSVSVTLANGKAYSAGSSLDSYLQNYFWGLKTCTIFLAVEGAPETAGSGTGFWKVGSGNYLGAGKKIGSGFVYSSTNTFSLASADIIIKGVISFPNVFDSWTDKEIEFSVFDNRYTDQFLASPNLFKRGDVTDSITFRYLGSGVEGQHIPTIYGDYSDEAVIPGFLISNQYSHQKIFKIADSTLCGTGQYPLTSISQVAVIAKDWTIFSSFTSDSNNGNVTVDIPNQIDTNQGILVACKGKTRSSAIAGFFGTGSIETILEHPAEVLFDLLVTRMGVAESFLNQSSFKTVRALDTSLKCRRWIGGGESISEVINDLCFEFGYELFNLFGYFHLVSQSVLGSSQASINQDHILSDTYQIQTDPNRTYFNSLAIRFRDDPDNAEFQSVVRLQNDAKISQHGKTQDFVYETKWNYLQAQVADRFSLLLSVFAGPLKIVNANLTSYAWRLRPTDVFDLTYHIFSSSNFLVRSVSKSLSLFTTAISGWEIGTNRVKDWAQDAASTPANYADAVSATYSIWHSTPRIVTGFNDTIKLTTSTTATATITAGLYTSVSSLASAIETAINAAVGTNVTVTYSSSTRKFTIATVDASNFTIHWTDTPEIGRDILGFNVSSNDTGAATYTSDYVAIFDLADGEAASQWG